MMQPKKVVIKAKYTHPYKLGKCDQSLSMYTPENGKRYLRPGH